LPTSPQWGVLSLLYEHDGQTIGTLSQQRAIDAPTMTGIVKRLEQNGVVERKHDREDRRVVKVYLTDEGRDIMRYQ
jgi:DNA-binding MarR family transcriptional regulator